MQITLSGRGQFIEMVLNFAQVKKEYIAQFHALIPTQGEWNPDYEQYVVTHKRSAMPGLMAETGMVK